MTDVTASLNLWIPQVQGQYINMDWNPTNKGFGAQCWDLAAHWSDFLGLPRVNTGYSGRWIGWAGNMVDAYPQTPEIEAAYELVGPNSGGLPGDIVVWGDSYWYYPATHVAVLVRDNGNQLMCMSQNSTPSQATNPYPGLSSGPTTIQSLPRQGLIGFLRPRVGLNFQGTITPTSATESEEDFMGGLINAQQAEDIAKRAAELVVEALNGSVLINPVQAESIVQATTERTTDAVDARSQGKQIDRQQADDIARAAARYSEAK